MIHATEYRPNCVHCGDNLLIFLPKCGTTSLVNDFITRSEVVTNIPYVLVDGEVQLAKLQDAKIGLVQTLNRPNVCYSYVFDLLTAGNINEFYHREQMHAYYCECHRLESLVRQTSPTFRSILSTEDTLNLVQLHFASP